MKGIIPWQSTAENAVALAPSGEGEGATVF